MSRGCRSASIPTWRFAKMTSRCSSPTGPTRRRTSGISRSCSTSAPTRWSFSTTIRPSARECARCCPRWRFPNCRTIRRAIRRARAGGLLRDGWAFGRRREARRAVPHQRRAPEDHGDDRRLRRLPRLAGDDLRHPPLRPDGTDAYRSARQQVEPVQPDDPALHRGRTLPASRRTSACSTCRFACPTGSATTA